MIKSRESPKARYLESSAVIGLAEDQNSHSFKLAISRKTYRITDFIITISVSVTYACTQVQKPACGAQSTALRVDSLSILMWD